MTIRIMSERDTFGDVYFFAEKRVNVFGLFNRWAYISNSISFKSADDCARKTRELLKPVPAPIYFEV